MERTSTYVLVTPLDDEDIVAALLHQVANTVLVAANVAHTNLFTRQLRTHHSNHQHVDTYNQQCFIRSLDK